MTDFRDDIFVSEDVTDILRGLFQQAEAVKQHFGMKDQDIEGCLVKESVNRFDTVFVQSRNQQGIGDQAMLVDFTPINYRQSRVDVPSLEKPDKTGGIDLTPANMNLQTQNNNGEIKFHLDPAMLKQLQNAPGFVPVIINIQPLKSLQEFLGLNQNTSFRSH